MTLGEITPEMVKTLKEANAREVAFWQRHGIGEESAVGEVSDAHRAWVSAVEFEYEVMGADVRVHLDTPLARKAFVLGYRMAQRQKRKTGENNGST